MKKYILIFVILIAAILMILLRTFNLNDTKSEIKSSQNLSGLAIMVQNEDDDNYDIWTDDTLPFRGYIYNHNKTICDNEEKLRWNKDKGTFELTTAKAQNCKVFFDRIEKVNSAIDISGNDYDGTFENGAVVKKDKEGNYGLYLDGIDDYVDVADLPETINWAGGFTIEFEALWADEFKKNYVRIIDFGRGSNADNIIVTSTRVASLTFSLRNGASYSDYIVYNNIPLNEKVAIKICFENNSFPKAIVFKDGEKVLEFSYKRKDPIINIERYSNYVGKSNWDEDYFHGYIYYIKITDAKGTPILWYDFRY